MLPMPQSSRASAMPWAALLLVLALLWERVVRHRFNGPPVDLSHFQR
jgi:hypothetical protein